MKQAPRIVIADDTSDFRYVLRQILELEGFDVVGEASDGEQAVALVAAQHPDAILLDLRMPNLSGADAVPRIRAAWPKTKIVVLSGFPEQQRLVQSLGVDAVALKGTELDQIVETLNELINRDG
ncbi:MAG TPA: response regulator transcription factor [Actinomycetota bacterium]|nr:response regulator transcription factor [Actinomycetota bacterium]